LRGDPATVLARLNEFELDEQQQAIVDRLKSLIELLKANPSAPAVVLDLSLIRPFDYYTGIVFEVVSRSNRQLGQGGRYDDLLAEYDARPEAALMPAGGRGFPGIGFVLNLEQLYQELMPNGLLPSETPPSDWLIVPKDESAAAAAIAYAQKIRQSKAESIVRVEMSLAVGQSVEEVRAIAKKRNIARIAWIPAEGAPEVEPEVEMIDKA